MNVFWGVLEASLMGTIGILLFCIISFTLKKRCQIEYKKIVWLLIALRLLVPIHITLLPLPLSIEVPNYILRGSSEWNNSQKTTESAKMLEPVNNSDAVQHWTTNHLVFFIWITGCVIAWAYYFAAYLITYKKLMCRSTENVKPQIREIYNTAAEELKIKKLPEIRIMEDTDGSPFTIGLLKNRVFLPDKDYLEQDLYYIIRHELIHCLNKDSWFKVILLLANVMHWFNPSVWIMRRLAEQDIELICDSKVLEFASQEERKEYSEVILSHIQTENRRYSVLSAGYIQKTNFIKKRFQNIFSTEQKKKETSTVILMIALLLLSGVFLSIRGSIAMYPKNKIPIESGLEVKTDVDGDGSTERVFVKDVVSGTDAFTQVVAQFNDGDAVFIDYPDYWSSYIISGDLSESGKADIVLIRYSIGSTYGAAEVSVIYMEDRNFKEYSSQFIKNSSIEAEQPDNFSSDNWALSCLGAAIIEKDGKNMLRLILNEDIQNDIVKCIDCSYRPDGWYIENLQIISDYYSENKDKELLNQ